MALSSFHAASAGRDPILKIPVPLSRTPGNAMPAVPARTGSGRSPHAPDAAPPIAVAAGPERPVRRIGLARA
ncbi:hypothetical protein [Labrys wisconsinensis]|uniref:Uncharacterized protein n=1 Tax=Labrys wisconsinensis TaxID=425677 RepID=A0ABU0JIE7_9HYPH|nr:hypothetical protein [Labrys wisconsinensis]MDQ0474050.1 hypothetical protein [Labrys wisconsinensis]